MILQRPSSTVSGLLRSDLAASGWLTGVDLVILDFDGVVADSEIISLGTLRDALAQIGIVMSLNEVRTRFLGTSLSTISAYVRDHATASDAARFAQGWQDAIYTRFRASLQPVPGIVAALDWFAAQGITHCIASSSRFERLAVALEAMGLSDRFPRVFSAEEVRHGKPAPDLFLHAAHACDCPPTACLVIEDSPFGITAAQSAGMRAVGFVGGAHLSGLGSEHAGLLSRAGALCVIESWQTVFSQPQNAGDGGPLGDAFEDDQT